MEENKRMSIEEFLDGFKEIVEKYGMEVVSQTQIKFKEVGLWDGMDCITFFRKPL